MSVSRTLRRSAAIGAAVVFSGLLAIAPTSVAQTPVTGDDGPHPAHIHSGTCGDELGDVVHPLTDVEAPTGEQAGAEVTHEIKRSFTLVDAPLEEIIAGGHAINVHLSADEIGTYIACGNIGGVVFQDDDARDEIVIALDEQNDSGHQGVAWLAAEGEQTAVGIILVEAGAMDASN